MSRILILGATGFIGRNMVEYFSKLGHEVYACGHKKNDFPAIKNVFWDKIDLRKPELVRFTRDYIDIIIQCAATTSGSKDIVNIPALHVTDNAVMNAYIFRSAVKAMVKHVIFFSCTTMFSDGKITEDSPIDIHPKYFGVAHTKLYNEKMCEFYSRIGDTKFTVVRHSNAYGPHDKFDLEKGHVFGATVKKVMDAEKIVRVWGSGEEERDLLHVDDLCRFVELAIEKQPDKFGLYNCGSGIAISVSDLVRKIIDASGKNLNIEYDLFAPTIPTSLSLDCTKAKNELGWEPLVMLDDGICRTLSWYKENVHAK